LDTSALIKLYIHEIGSEKVNHLVIMQDDPLPICDLHILEFTNAIKLKCFRKEINLKAVNYILTLFNERIDEGCYFIPEFDRLKHLELSLAYTDFSINIGCRSLDILHVSAAKLFKVNQFITCDEKQIKCATMAGLVTVNPITQE
jgi:predicted nucleic acid-binding protein